MKDKKVIWIGVAFLGWLVVLWLAFLIAPTMGHGLSVMLQKLTDALSNPLYLVWSKQTPMTLFVFTLISFS